ncbi:hypothetical protein [Saccharopolyspora sp. SCSIO 74807]|uniref:hypothetical protein n=1 Tax=Saccharopolyspora sp. SCSIO 74807 TaxID=3118084 RepID=UPI0030D1CCC8
MGGTLRVNSLAIQDRRGWQKPYELTGRLVGIIGPIDRGKSSMVDCIDFVLGRSVRFKGAVDDQLVAVKAGMQIGDEEVFLHRSRRRLGVVRVEDLAGDEIATVPINASGDQQELSDWLLARLGLDDAFASVRLPHDRRLSFASDLLPYLHVRQEDIDRFVIRPQTSADDAARLAVAKLLLELINPASERLGARIHDLNNEIRNKQRKADQVRDFLNASPETNSGTLDADLDRLRDDETQAAQRLKSLRDRARAATQFAEQRQQQVDRARQRLATAEDGVDWALRRHREKATALAQIDASLAELGEVAAASSEDRERLALLYDACPACETDLSSRAVPTGRCSLCTETLPGAAQHKEKQQLQRARERLVPEVAELEQNVTRARHAADLAREQLALARRAVDEDTADAVTPYVDAITAAATELEALRSEITTLERLKEPHRRLSERQEEINRLSEELDQAREQQVRVGAELNEPDDVLQRLNNLFGRVVSEFRLPWATGRARLDRDTLLPMVDDQDFDQRGGGSRTAVSVAYSLTLMMYALEDPTRFQLPQMLILDSPQKNLGRNDHDQDLATRIYRWIIDYFEVRREALGGRYETFQLVIVDNNIPTAVRSGFDTLIQFKDPHGFIRDLDHPHGEPAGYEQLALDDELDHDGL